MSELSRDEALAALDRRVAELEERYYEVYAWQGKANGRFIALEGRTALAGGGGGEKAERRFWEEVRRRDNEIVKYLTELGAANAAFHAGWKSRADYRKLESRLAAAEKRAEEACREREAFYERVMELTSERDAALARVKELEADLELSESHRSTVQGRLASIARLAEGAQP